MTGVAVRCVDVSHDYDLDGEAVPALIGIELAIDAGERVALFGPSGSGKSTLTALLAGLRRPTRGQVLVGDVDLATAAERTLLAVRGGVVGMVLQNPSRSLLPYATAEENIAFARRGVARGRRGALPGARPLLDGLGMGELAGQRTGQMSGGEQQRLSIAVAMATSPQLLLADEPTSQLDTPNRDRVVELLARIGAEFGTTIVAVTHDPAVADALDRRVTLAAGRIVSDVVNR